MVSLVENKVVIFEDSEVIVKKVVKNYDGSISYVIVEDCEGNKIIAKEYQLKSVLLG